MKVSDFLAPRDVMIGVAAPGKRKLLETLAQKAGAIVDVPPDRLLAELRKREELGSTGVGGGVALPHARYHQVSKPIGMLLRLRQPIEFDAVDGELVDIVFLLLLPETTDGGHLDALASVARVLRKPAITAALRAAPDAAQIYHTLTTA